MKALKILDNFSNIHESAYSFNGVIVATLGDINNVIEELKALQNKLTDAELGTSKTCEGCVHLKIQPETEDYGEYKECDSNMKWKCSRYFNRPTHDYYVKNDE